MAINIPCLIFRHWLRALLVVVINIIVLIIINIIIRALLVIVINIIILIINSIIIQCLFLPNWRRFLLWRPLQ